VAIAAVQTFGKANSVSNADTFKDSVAGVSPTTAGNCIVAWAFGYKSDAGTITGVTFSDTEGNTYVVPAGAFQHNNVSADDAWVAIGFCENIIGGTSGNKVRVTPSANCGMDIVAVEFSGVKHPSAQDGAAVGANGTASPIAPGNMTIQAGSLVAVSMVSDDGGALTSPTAPWVSLDKEDGPSPGWEPGEAMYALSPGSPSNPTWTRGSPNVGDWHVAQLALLVAPVGGVSVFLLKA
jgi:hypothetical protein